MRSGEETGTSTPGTAVPSSCARPRGKGVTWPTSQSPRGSPQKEGLPHPHSGVEKVVLTWVRKQFPLTHLWVSLSPLFDAVIVLMTWDNARTCAAMQGAIFRTETRTKAMCVAWLLPAHPCAPSLPPAFFLSVLCFVFITLQEPWGV